jgi:hypothetical protein
MNLPRLELDYVARPTRTHWAGLLLLTAALGIAAKLGLHYRDILREKAQLEAVYGVAPAERATSPVPLPQNYAEQARTAQATVRQLSLPWSQLIRALEDAATQDVAVLQVQPEAQQQRVRITAEARNQDAMLEYLHKLAAAPALNNVHWTSHQVLAEDPQRPLQFSVLATFRLSP